MRRSASSPSRTRRDSSPSRSAPISPAGRRWCARPTSGSSSVGDALGHRGKLAVLAPSTNTSVQPEYDAMRPWGVTHHHSRLVIPDRAVTDDASFMQMMDDIRGALLPALESVLTCDPDYVVLGMSAETFWDGLAGSRELREKLEKTARRGVAMGSDACQAALRAYGSAVRRLGVITPYMPAGDRQVQRFFTECGFEVGNLLGLKCESP